jgi:hypothetical protein
VSNLSRRIEFRQGFRAYRDIRHSPSWAIAGSCATVAATISM